MKKLFFPPPLLPGDTIGVFAPSSWVERDDIEKSSTLIEQHGYKVFIHPQTYERDRQSAGTHLQKTLALQGLWHRDDIKALWAAGGGNRCFHLLDMLNYEKMAQKPKILIGFSDVTALLNAVTAQTGIVTYHGPVFKNLTKHNQLSSLLKLLSGELISYPMDKAIIVKHGRAEGFLRGGNLSLFQYVSTTLPDTLPEGSILFLEDCNEELSRIDRMFLFLKRSGVFKKISALLLGEFSDLKETGRAFGFTLEEIVREHTQDLDIPVVMNLPFGHGKNLYTFPVGGTISVNTKKNILKLI